MNVNKGGRGQVWLADRFYSLPLFSDHEEKGEEEANLRAVGEFYWLYLSARKRLFSAMPT